MFWSSDLLSIQGGKFSKIWQLGSEDEGGKSEVKLYDIQASPLSRFFHVFFLTIAYVCFYISGSYGDVLIVRDIKLNLSKPMTKFILSSFFRNSQEKF